METVAEMSVTLRHIPGTELSPILQNRANVKPHQTLTITIEVEGEEGTEEEYDMENLGDTLLESLNEIAEAKKQGRELPNARDLLNSL